MIDQTISQYKIVEKLGEGGMGVVYKAQDTKLNRIVALKFLPHHLAKGTSEQTRFLQEAQAVAILNHPNICVIHDVREEDGKQFIVMEFVEGKTVRETFLKGKIKIETAIDYAIQIAEALEEAHTKGIVHRDIKADNIMINSKNQVKVMDFGLAKLKGSLKLTRTSSTVGTLAYMAPEQMQGGEVDPRSDIFSFGVLFFEMLSGRLPFRGEHEAAMMYSIINEDPENIQKFVPDAPAELSFLLKTALEKNQDDRFQHMSDIVRDLRRLKKQSSRVNRPQYSGEYKKIEEEKTQHSSSQHQSADTPKNSKKTLQYIVGGLVVMILIFAGLMLFMQNDPIPFTKTQMSRITSTGKIFSASISQDGRYVAYVQLDKGKYSLWVKQLATSSNIQIRIAQKAAIADPVFSNDGNFIFYRMGDDVLDNYSLYKIPVLGGNSVKILDNVQSSVTLSPDGKQLAFRRVYPESGNFALVVASVDGSQQKDLSAYKGDLWINGNPSWSPDGKMIAASLGSWEGGFHHTVVGFDVTTAEMKKLSTHQWDDVSQVNWLSNGKGLVVEASSINIIATQLFFIEYPSGTVSKVTNDLNNYLSSSLTNDFKTLCTVLNEQELYLYFVQNGDAKHAKKITSQRNDGDRGLTISSKNELYYSSRQNGAFDIWKSELNGENQQQITFDEFLEFDFSVSTIAKSIVFTSSKGGIPNIWSLKTDGTGLKQLTKDAEDYRPTIDATGKWVVFDSWLRGPNTIMKVLLDGGERVDITSTQGTQPSITNDGKRVIFRKYDDQRKVQTMYAVPLEGGTPKYLFDLSSDAENEMVMRPNSNDISYILTENGVSNIYIRSLDGGAQKRYTDFDEYFITNFAWTNDGKSLIVSRGDIRSDVVIIADEQNKTVK
ncbi:MAG: protein kinase [Bacteroidota bacterium]